MNLLKPVLDWWKKKRNRKYVYSDPAPIESRRYRRAAWRNQWRARDGYKVFK